MLYGVSLRKATFLLPEGASSGRRTRHGFVVRRMGPPRAPPLRKFRVLSRGGRRKPQSRAPALLVHPAPTMQRTLYTLPRALLLRSRCTQQRALSSSLPPHRLMPMPRLSPSMNTGRLDQWLVAVGDEVVSEHIICEVSTSELTEDPDDGTLVLQIESHEDGFLAKILLPDVRALAPNPHAVSAAAHMLSVLPCARAGRVCGARRANRRHLRERQRRGRLWRLPSASASRAGHVCVAGLPQGSRRGARVR